MFRVSGTNFATKNHDKNENTAKIANGPPTLLWNKARIVRKNCETMKFATQLVADPMSVPIPRTDSGKISPINNQAIGPP